MPLIKRMCLNVFKFIKIVYITLFKFMIGENRKNRIFVHFCTVMCLTLFPAVLISQLVQLYMSDLPIIVRFVYTIFALFFFALFPCGVKLMTYLSNRWPF